MDNDMIEIFSDYICGNKFVDICDYKITTNDFIIDVEQLKKNQLVFVKTDKLKDFFDTIRNLPYNYAIITHNSDHNIDEEKYSWKPDNVKLWFAQNVLIDKSDLTPIPIGLENTGVGQSGNIQDFIDIYNEYEEKEKVNFLYSNFANGTNSMRSPLKEYLRNYNWVKTEVNRIPFRDYLKEITLSNFVLCPPGNGSDCHRTWETLYMGSIPICFNNAHNFYFYKEFYPILGLFNEIEYITKENLDNGLMAFDIINNNILRFSYWKDLILEKTKNIL